MPHSDSTQWLFADEPSVAWLVPGVSAESKTKIIIFINHPKSSNFKTPENFPQFAANWTAQFSGRETIVKRGRALSAVAIAKVFNYLVIYA